MPDASPDPLAAWAVLGPLGPAVVESGQVTTRAEFDQRVSRLASGLAALGIRPGERVVWCGPNSTEVMVAMLACRRLGVVAVPMPYRLTAGECLHMLADSGAAAVLVDAAVAPVVAGALAQLPGVRLAVSFRGDTPGMRAWDDVLGLGSPEETPPAPDGGRTMFYTSGTSGRPKGAVRNRADPARREAMLAELGLGPDEVHLVTGPLYHAGPHAFAVLAHLAGGVVIVAPSFDPVAWIRTVGEHRVTSAFVAPIHLARVVALPHEVLAGADLSSLRSVIVNAAPVPYALKQAVIAKLGPGFLYEVYGATELGIVTVLRPEEQLSRPGSCGRACAGVGLAVVDERGADMAPGGVGQIFVHTAQSVDGYHGGAGALATLAGRPDWKSVGDVGWLDPDGFLHICDRRSDLVITGGVNVYPAEVEAALHAHPDVADAAVIGVPDDDWGERVHAVVAPQPGRALDPAALDAFLAGRLAGFKRPRSWEVRDTLPRTDSGKLLRRVLRAEHRREEPSQV